MLPLQIADLEMGIRAVLAAEDPEQGDLAKRLVDQTQHAEAYRHRTGRLHPEFGNGTLYAAALAMGPAARPATLGRAELLALHRLIAALLKDEEHHAA